MVFTDKGLKAIRDEVNSLHEQRVDRLTNINVGCIPPETFADVVKRTPPGGTIYWPSVGCVAPGTIVDCEDKPLYWKDGVYWSTSQNPVTWNTSSPESLESAIIYKDQEKPPAGSHYTSFSVDDIESPSQELLQKWLDWYKDHNLWEDGEKPQGRFEALLDKYDDLLSRFGE